MAGIGITPMTPRQRFVLVTCALLAAVTLVVIGQLNSVLAAMHPDGGVSGSVDDLTVSLVPLRAPSEVDVQAVVGSWKAYDARVVSSVPELGYAGPLTTANAALRWDVFLLIPAYTVFILMLLRWARSWPPPPPGQPVPRAIWSLGRWWFLYVVLAVTVVADLVENVFLSRAIDQAWESRPLEGINVVTAAGIVKWAGLLLALAPFVVVAVRVGAAVARPVLRTAWFPIALLVVLGVAVNTDQAADVVRRWGIGQIIWTMLGVSVLALVVATAGSRSFQIGRTPITVRAQGRPLTFAALARAALALLPLVAIAVVLLLVARALDWSGFVTLGLVLGAAYLLSLPIRHFWEGEQTVEVPTVQTAPAPLRHRTGAVLAGVVPFLVGIAVVRAMTADVFYTRASGVDRDLVLLVFGFALAVAGSLAAATLAGMAIRWLSEGGRMRRWGLLVALLVAVGLPSALLALRSTSVTVAQGLGATTIVLVFLGALGLVGALLYVAGDTALRTKWARESALPPAVRLLGFERPPLVGLLVLWVALASLLDVGTYHDVRQLSRSEVDVRPATVSDVFTAWQQRQPDAAVTDGSSQPMLLVAASGGGLRSAYWTSLVLDCVIERVPDPATGDPCGAPADGETVDRRRARLFAMSGVSGGALGLVGYDAHTDVDTAVVDTDWYDRRLRDDFLSPTLAWWLFRDTPAALLRPGGGRDRAAALERAWERPWRQDGDALAEPFLTRQSALEGPLLLLSGYTMEDGCRLSASILPTSGGRPIDQCASLDPAFAQNTHLNATTDLLDFLCLVDGDVRRSTAALLTARFPYISPAGRLLSCSTGERDPRAFVVDGGYRDTSAASPVVELWPGFQSFVEQANGSGVCIIPYFVQIDSDADPLPPAQPAAAPSQLLAPLTAIQALPGSNADAARVAAQRTFSGPLDARGTVAVLDGQRLENRWVRIAPRAHPGASAPLSWVLSETARDDLRQQVAYNTEGIDGLRRLLDAPSDALVCQPGPVP